MFRAGSGFPYDDSVGTIHASTIYLTLSPPEYPAFARSMRPTAGISATFFGFCFCYVCHAIPPWKIPALPAALCCSVPDYLSLVRRARQCRTLSLIGWTHSGLLRGVGDHGIPKDLGLEIMGESPGE